MAEDLTPSPAEEALDSTGTGSGSPGEERDLFRKLSRWIKADIEARKDWQDQAEEDYQFVAGDQWEAEDKEKMQEAGRPCITYNRIAPAVRAAAGTEMTAPLATTYKPGELSDKMVAEVWTRAGEWARSISDMADAESDAFVDSLICGEGWIELLMDYDEAEEGEPMEIRLDPLEVYPDYNAQRRNYVDARRVSHVKRVPLDVAREMFPDASEEDLDAAWADGAEAEGERSSHELDRLYAESDPWKRDKGDQERMVTIVRCQWRERQRVAELLDPQSGQQIEMPERRFRQMQSRAQEMGVPLQGRVVSRMVYRQAYIGRRVLREGPAPLQTGFTIEGITGIRDHAGGSYYGLVRHMKDPQRFANKMLSSTMDQLMVGAKGGVFLEEDAVDDQAQFERSYNRYDEITFLRPGTLANGKWAQKPVNQLPAGHYQMMQFSMEQVHQVGGISEEMMGTREASQPGVLEQQRRTQGLVMLAPFTRGLRHFRKRMGRRLLELMREYISPQRMAAVLGPEIPPPAIMQAYQSNPRLDIVVDEAPNSASQKELVWALLQPIFQTLPPQVQMELWAYSPLPATAVEKIREGYNQAMQPPPPDPQQQALAEAELQKAQNEAEAVKSEIAENSANAALDRVKAAREEAELRLMGYERGQSAALGGMPAANRRPA